MPEEQTPLEKVISSPISKNLDSSAPVEDLVKNQPMTIDDLFDMEPEKMKDSDIVGSGSGRRQTRPPLDESGPRTVLAPNRRWQERSTSTRLT